jgi:hypothetical protein
VRLGQIHSQTRRVTYASFLLIRGRLLAARRACAHDPADLTDREAATAWDHGRPNHMINSGQFLFQPQSRPLKRSQLAIAPPAVRCWDRSPRVRRAVRPAQNGDRSIWSNCDAFCFYHKPVDHSVCFCQRHHAGTLGASPSWVGPTNRPSIGWMTPPPALAADSARRSPCGCVFVPRAHLRS